MIFSLKLGKFWYNKFNVMNEKELNMDIGNKIYQRIGLAKKALFAEGELMKLTHTALKNEASKIENSRREEIKKYYPIGYSQSKGTIFKDCTYKKQELINKYKYLIKKQLAINGIYSLVTIIEALMGDILRMVIVKFPEKISSNKTINYGIVLSKSSIEEIHLHVIDKFLHELAYTSPEEFSKECKKLLSVDLLEECPAFYKYIEIKATRDIYLHNQGIANGTYIQKAYSHSRVKSGEYLPIDLRYFLESYEECLEINKWLEISLHNVWYSSEFE